MSPIHVHNNYQYRNLSLIVVKYTILCSPVSDLSSQLSFQNLLGHLHLAKVHLQFLLPVSVWDSYNPLRLSSSPVLSLRCHKGRNASNPNSVQLQLPFHQHLWHIPDEHQLHLHLPIFHQPIQLQPHWRSF